MTAYIDKDLLKNALESFDFPLVFSLYPHSLYTTSKVKSILKAEIWRTKINIESAICIVKKIKITPNDPELRCGVFEPENHGSSEEEEIRQNVVVEEVQTTCAFYKKGKVWVIKFNNEECFLPNSAGLFYLWSIISNAASGNKFVDCVNLYFALNPIAGDTIEIELEKEQSQGNSDFYGSTGKSRQTLLRKAIKKAALEKDANTIQDNIKNETNFELVQEYKEELREIYLKLKELGDVDIFSETNKLNDTVRQRIKHALDEIKNESLAIYNHFNVEVGYNDGYYYANSQNIKWILTQ